MRKLLILLGVMVISLILTACTGTTGEITAPTFVGVRVEYTDPKNGDEFYTFYRAKQSTVLVEVTLSNPSDVDIKSIVIEGYTHIANKFTDNSTNEVIYFELNVGSTLGEKIYSVDRINYLDGDNSVSVNITSNNDFKVYVFKGAPTVTRENYSLTREQISIDFNIVDNDMVITDGTLIAYLYAGETLVEQKPVETGLVQVNFNGLLANRLYEVKILASYDLDDNTGPKNNVVLYSGSYSTVANGLPSATISNVEITSNMVTFDVSYTDTDQVVVPGGLHVGIFNGDTLIETLNITGSTAGLSFEDLLNDNSYVIKVLADYDLKDGLGTRTNNLLGAHSFSTLPRAIPLPELFNLDLQENSIEFDVFIDDPSGIIDETTILANLYIEGVFVTSSELYNYSVDFQVNNLFANKEFTIELFADYDLNDGAGTQPNQLIFEETYSTLENAKPIVDILSLVVTQGYVTIDLTVQDEHNTLVGAMEAVLYEDDVAVMTIPYDATTTEMVFAYPTVAELNYYIEFYADYNLRDGSGQLTDQSLRRIVLFTKEAKAPIAEIKDVVKTNSSISFDIKVIDADETIVDNETFIQIYLDGVLVNSQAIAIGETSIIFDNLLSNNNYQIIVQSDYNLDDGSGVLENRALLSTYILTNTKLVPTIITSNTSSTDESISLDANIVDVDSVVETGSVVAKLFYSGVEIDSKVITVGENFGISFTGLLSNNNYKVVFYLDYDLNDGNGIIGDYVVGEVTIRTAAKLAPTASFIFQSSDTDSITVDILVTDTYGVQTGDLKAILVLNDVPTGDEVDLNVGINSNVTFSNIYSNERYYIYVIADYDLNDGAAVYEDVILSTNYVQTVSLLPITASISTYTTTTSTIRLDVDVVDPSNAITGNLQAVLYKDDVATGDVQPLVVGSNVGVTFAGVDSATEYKIQIETDYDLNEFTGPVLAALLDETIVTTNTLSEPTMSITNQVEDFDELTVDLYIEDVDNTITGNIKAVLYEDGVATLQEFALVTGENENLVFTGLVSNKEYEVRAFADYDLNDGTGPQTNMELGFAYISTLAKLIPSVTLNNQTITYTTVSFEFDLEDTYNVLTSTNLRAGLYVDGVLQTSKLLFTNSVSFGLTGFIANTDIEIRITGNYDLEDGAPVHVGGTIASMFFTTLSYPLPIGVVEDVTIGQDGVDTIIEVTDSMDVISGGLTAVLYDKDEVAIGAPIGLVVGNNNITFPQTLTFNEAYSVVVYADYNLFDGVGEQTGMILAEYFIVVPNKLLPEALISNVVVGEEDITFDVEILDHDAVIIPATIEAELYLDGALMASAPLVPGVNLATVFNTLLSNRDYVLLIVANYDNGNGNGVIAHYEMTTSSQKTLAKDVPTAVILSDTLTATQIVVDITVIDNDSITSALDAVLYNSLGVEVARQALVVGDNFNVTFSGLLGSSTFSLVVETTYDANDGAGDIDSTIATQAVTTLDSIPPIASIGSIDSTLSTLIVTYDFSDTGMVSTEQYLRIYESGVYVDQVAIVSGNSQVHTFTGLDPYTEYEVTIESSYDLNDLNGLQTDVVLFTSQATTDTFISIENELNEKSTNTLDVLVDDYEGIISGAWLEAKLYQEGSPIATYLINENNASTTLDMINLMALYDYTLEIEATYDIGTGDKTQVVYVHEFSTEALVKPTIIMDEFAAWTFGANLSLDLEIGVDEDGVAVDSSYVANLYVDGVLEDTVDLYVLNGSANPEDAGTLTVVFSGYTILGTETSYTVVITADADMNLVYGEGAVETVIFARTGIDAGN